MSEPIYPGDTITLQVDWTDANGPADPTALTLYWRQLKPGQSPTTYSYAGGTITKAQTGRYTRSVTIPSARSASGPWEQFWIATWSDGTQRTARQVITVSDAEALSA